jgi:hypothetical protein
VQIHWMLQFRRNGRIKIRTRTEKDRESCERVCFSDE